MNIRADTKRFFTGTGQQYYADLRISFQRVAMRQQLFEHLWG
ncbi:unknown [Escherichia coli CAG:4]|nr:unknown [Escherichia coli CAG:4]